MHTDVLTEESKHGPDGWAGPRSELSTVYNSPAPDCLHVDRSLSIESKRHAAQVRCSQHISSCGETASFLTGVQICKRIDTDALKCVEYLEI